MSILVFRLCIIFTYREWANSIVTVSTPVEIAHNYYLVEKVKKKRKKRKSPQFIKRFFKGWLGSYFCLCPSLQCIINVDI